MVRTYWADESEKNEIIDFIDYVFSKAHRPHDFETLLPKLYGPNGDAAQHHIVVREDGKIAAALLCYPVTLHAGEKTYMTLGIGSVSVHPRARGKGYLGEMMKMVDQRAKALGAVFAALGGQRQRYQYYGFDHGGYQLRATLRTVNVRHALRGVEEEAFDVIPMTQAHGDLTICAAPWQRERAGWLSSVCEEYALAPNCMMKVYDPVKAEEICASLDSFSAMGKPLFVAPPDAV